MSERMLSWWLLGLVLWGVGVAPQRQSSGLKASYITYDEARPVLEALSDALPAELRAVSATELPSVWSQWVVQRDAEIRARLVQGNEDSLINFLLFGTSFTRRARITLKDLAQANATLLTRPDEASIKAAAVVKAIQERAEDLVNALATPGRNERLLFARELLESKGYAVGTAESRARARQYLAANLARVLNENASYARLLESARLLDDASAEFAERSKLYGNRGLSSDTSLLPNFALERALASLKARRLLAPASVRRVGIIGPGLDFTDKQDGYDFYPQQTIQPFAVIDSLLKLGLARANDLHITTLDLNPRVNDHLRRALAKARQGVGYTIQLPRDSGGQWKPEAVDYWAKFGDWIGGPVAPVAVPSGLAEVKNRAVRVRPAIISVITPEDTNVVLQRLDLPAGKEFDLLIATNILVYYQVFEQSLALANVERMLRPGGFLLSNNALLELPSSRMRSVGYDTVVYSDRPNDGDHIVWYQRQAK